MGDKPAPATGAGGGGKRVLFTVEAVKEDKPLVRPEATSEIPGGDVVKEKETAAVDAGTSLVVESKPPVQPSKTPAAESKPPSSDSEDEDQNEILEESPCGRWWKRREQVKQRDVPGIDVAYLAMDNETGNEVVWNEVQFSERKNFRAQEEKIKAIFDNLTQLQHTNLVTFHKYWTDSKSELPRVIFITEYMSSGSMSQFMKRTRKGSKALSEKAWKKWCTQILSALTYLHSSDSPIVHGNLSCNTIFIQQNGLIKIGCVAPSTIHHHVKTFRDNMRNMHYIAPEYELGTTVTPAADIYAFGICALEMAALGFVSSNGAANAQEGKDTSSSFVSIETIQNTLNSLDSPLMRDFIERCLVRDPTERPTARELLFHSCLFEVHSLLLLACHEIVRTKLYDQLAFETFNLKPEDKDKVYATCRDKVFRYANAPHIEVDKFLEDVRNGIYPLTAFSVPMAQKMTSIQSQGALSGSSISSTASTAAAASTGASVQNAAQSTPQAAAASAPNTQQHNSGTPVPSAEGVAAVGALTAVNATDKKANPVGDTKRADSAHDQVLSDKPSASKTPVQLPAQASLPNAGVEHKSGTPDTDKADGAVNGDLTVAQSMPALKSAPSDSEVEHRKILRMSAELKHSENGAWTITLLLKLEDTMNRQLTAEIYDCDTAEILVDELIQHGFIHDVSESTLSVGSCSADKTGLTAIIAQTLSARDQERATLEGRKDSIVSFESDLSATSSDIVTNAVPAHQATPHKAQPT